MLLPSYAHANHVAINYIKKCEINKISTSIWAKLHNERHLLKVGYKYEYTNFVLNIMVYMYGIYLCHVS